VYAPTPPERVSVGVRRNSSVAERLWSINSTIDRAILGRVKGSNTKNRICVEALDHVSKHGLCDLTIGGLADRVGMSKSGLFAHFSSKESLQIGVLRAAQKLAQQAVFDGYPEGLDALGRLANFFERWTGWATRSGLPGGCPFVAAVFEFDDRDGPIRDELMAIQGDFFVRVIGLVQDAVDSRQLFADTDVTQVVWEIVAIYNGHHVAQRFLRDSAADQRAKTAFQGLLARYQPTQPTTHKVRGPNGRLTTKKAS
jgi:AcrR family transcriptional regulator